MQRVEVERYGELAFREVERPEPGDGEVLVRVDTASVNVMDWYFFHGRPYVARAIMGVRRPKSPTLGADFAGVVEAVGAGVDELAAGDTVFGVADGAFGDYVVARNAVRAPANVPLEAAAAVGVAGLTALQGLRDHGGVKPDARVLVNGASGGVGTFAVQVAKALGAEVHAVCSAAKVEQARELGASRVFDYTRDDFAQSGEQYDVIFDNAGSRPWRALRRVLAPEGVVVLCGGPKRNRLFGPLGHMIGVKVATRIARRRAASFIAKPNKDDLAALRDLIEAGSVAPAVERRYGFEELGEALAAIGEGHARAKLVLTRH